jgi:hypothetical protein
MLRYLSCSGLLGRHSTLKKHISIPQSKEVINVHRLSLVAVNLPRSPEQQGPRAVDAELRSETTNKHSSIKRKKLSMCLGWVLLQKANLAPPSSRLRATFTMQQTLSCVLK